jgi:GTP-binding protein EngB required for normal cell division
MIGRPIPRRADRSGGLPERIEALATAVDLAQDRLDRERVAFARQVVGKAEARLRHGTTATLVALLGATGSGKSSVANLVVDTEVARTGVRRPTTSSTLAISWGDEDTGALLDWMEVVNRHRVPAEGESRDLGGLVLLDVPDHDSVAEAHRVEMERIADHADMLVWVTDPEKYADKAMHDYLARLSGHGGVMALVLNKIDLLTPAEAEACRIDLKRLLAGVGLDRAPVVTLSALGGQGWDELRALLADTVERKQAAVERLAADTALAAGELLGEIGPSGGPDSVPATVSARLAEELVSASGVDIVAEAVDAGHRRDAVRRTGWPFTRWVRRLRPHPLRRLHLGPGSVGRASRPEPSGVQRARSDGAIRTAAEAVARDLPEPWPDHIRSAASPDPSVLTDRLDTAVAGAVREQGTRHPRWWAATNVLQVTLAAAVIAGVVWLALLAFAAYLRVPEPPTPEVRGVPIPTGLVIAGIVLGLLVAAGSSRLARLSGRRRARAVRRRAERAVGEVARELVIEPVDRELARRRELRGLLELAAGGRRSSSTARDRNVRR